MLEADASHVPNQTIVTLESQKLQKARNSRKSSSIGVSLATFFLARFETFHSLAVPTETADQRSQ